MMEWLAKRENLLTVGVVLWLCGTLAISDTRTMMGVTLMIVGHKLCFMEPPTR